MILIANKGLMDGPDATLENKPEQVLAALNAGFQAKVDVWVVDNKIYLGQDSPQYEIALDFLQSKPIWVQAKNTDALYFLSQTIAINYFWHQTDDHVITRNAFLWTNPGKALTPRSIQVLPEISDPQFQNLNLNCYGICSDFVNQLKDIIN
jgi:hypothetical protein